jgi:zinc transporter, ZIP family
LPGPSNLIGAAKRGVTSANAYSSAAVSVLAVFVVALATALATGLGVIPVMAVRANEHRAIALSSGLAAGFMLGASAALFYEGVLRDPLGTGLGALAGVGFILATRALLGRQRDAHIGQLRGARGMTALLVIGVMTVHSFTEGVALGVSFAGEESLGILIAIAIAIHNIPEGVAVSLALVPFGEPPHKAALWSIFSSFPQPLMAVPAFLAVRTFEPLLSTGLGFAGGAMVWMVFTQLLPETLAGESRRLGIVAVSVSGAVMLAIEFLIGV